MSDKPSLLVLPPLSLYVHIPWCIRKCPYCDFNSHESQSIPEEAYIAALTNDLQQDMHWIKGRKLRSIFFGGGTPSLFSADAIEAILTLAEKNIGFDDKVEITLEANPGTFEQQKFSDYYQAGINRLSIGIQSFQAQHLEKLGRVHDQNEAIKAVSMAQQAGFNNINIDLMHGLPKQTLQEAKADLETAIALAPQHISWYQLTIEPNTVFYRQPPALPNDDVLADIQSAGEQQLASHGYQQYEVSAFCQQKRESQHNLNYWQFGDYIGIGAGAHGKFTDIDRQAVIRRQKTRLPEHYLARHPSVKEHRVPATELPLEFMMNSLRLVEGVPSRYFSERTGLAPNNLEPTLSTLVRQGFINANTQDQIKTTDLGQRFLNTVLSHFQ